MAEKDSLRLPHLIFHFFTDTPAPRQSAIGHVLGNWSQQLFEADTMVKSLFRRTLTPGRPPPWWAAYVNAPIASIRAIDRHTVAAAALVNDQYEGTMGKAAH